MATHHFEPTVYYTAIGAHEPVLHIESGDTVFTTTVPRCSILRAAILFSQQPWIA